MTRLAQRFRRWLGRPNSYDPRVYWESRSQDLIETYDDPASWSSRNWPTSDLEQVVVPRLLEQTSARSAFVVGAGSGRQYVFLQPLGVELRGLDISPSLVAECRRRFPSIETHCDTLLGMEQRYQPAEAVLASAVLQHVPPKEFANAIRSVKAMATRLVVIREVTWMAIDAGYMWTHDYVSAFADWPLLHNEVTDRTERYEVRLLAWTPATLDDR